MPAPVMAVYQGSSFEDSLRRVFMPSSPTLYITILFNSMPGKNRDSSRSLWHYLTGKRLPDLHVTASLGSTSLFIPGERLKKTYPQGTSVTSVEKVNAVTIDGWVKHHGDTPIQLMKFDIQGGELLALRGAAHVLQTSTLLIYTEILFNSLYDGGAIYSEIDLYLRECGFVLYDIL